MLRIQWHICKDGYSGIYFEQRVHILIMHALPRLEYN